MSLTHADAYLSRQEYTVIIGPAVEHQKPLRTVMYRPRPGLYNSQRFAYAMYVVCVMMFPGMQVNAFNDIAMYYMPEFYSGRAHLNSNPLEPTALTALVGSRDGTDRLYNEDASAASNGVEFICHRPLIDQMHIELALGASQKN